jgi:HAMP domain
MQSHLSDPRRAPAGMSAGLIVQQPAEEGVPDLLGQPGRQAGLWGMWLSLTTARLSAPPGASLTTRQREYLRRSRLLSTLQLTAVILTAILLPRGFLPVLDPGTLLGVGVFALILLASIVLNRQGQVMPAAALFTIGLAAAIAGSQLATPTGKINFQDLAGYDVLVIPLVIAGVLLPSRATILLWAGSVLFVVLDLGLAVHGTSLERYLPSDLPPFLRVYPVAIYPLVLTTVVAVISWMAGRSVASALEEADRTTELEQAYALLADQKRRLEESIGTLQQVHARVANGDLSARAPIRPGDPLLQLGVSLNLTLDRLARSTMSAATLEAVEQETAVLSEYVGELAQANLHRPAPAHAVQRLAPLAYNLEQLRAGMLQAIGYTREMVEQIAVDNAATSQQVRLLAPQKPAEPEVIGMIWRGVEAVNTDTHRLHQYLSRFL